MLIGSLAHTATLTSLAFILGSSLSASSMVVPSTYGLDLLTSNASLMKMEPWEQPCGSTLNNALKRSAPRHSVHRTLKRVKTQLRVAKDQFRQDLKDIHDIYSKVYKVLKGQYHMNWLPTDQLDWYYNDLWCEVKDKKAEFALPKLYDGLQRFAITFQSLKTFRLKSNINVEHTINRRNEIVSGIQYEVLRMLCEVETAILNLGFPLPNVHKSGMVTESPDWANQGDLTLMLIQDWGVLRLYRAFLHDWTFAFRNATAKGPGTCDPQASKPLLYRPKSKNTKKILRRNKNLKNPKHSRNLTPLSSRRRSGNRQMPVATTQIDLNYLRKKSIRRRRMRNRQRVLKQ